MVLYLITRLNDSILHPPVNLFTISWCTNKLVVKIILFALICNWQYIGNSLWIIIAAYPTLLVMNIWLQGSITIITIWILDSNTEVEDFFHSNILILLHTYLILIISWTISFGKSFSILFSIWCLLCWFVLFCFVLLVLTMWLRFELQITWKINESKKLHINDNLWLNVINYCRFALRILWIIIKFTYKSDKIRCFV